MSFLQRIKQQQETRLGVPALKLAYILDATPYPTPSRIRLAVGTLNPLGQFERTQTYRLQRQHLQQAPSFFTPVDAKLLADLLQADAKWADKDEGELPTDIASAWLMEACQSGCLYGSNVPGQVTRLTWAEPLLGQPVWLRDSSATQRLDWDIAADFSLIDSQPLLYFSPQRAVVGPLQHSLNSSALPWLAQRLSVQPEEIEAFIRSQEAIFRELALPLPKLISVRHYQPPPRRSLTFDGAAPTGVSFAVHFEYPAERGAAWQVSPEDSALQHRYWEEEELCLLSRDEKAETVALLELAELIAEFHSSSEKKTLKHWLEKSFSPASYRAWRESCGQWSQTFWRRFMIEGLPRLITAGWSVQIQDGFYYHYVRVAAYSMRLSTQANGWLELAPGIQIDGETHDLLPLLQQCALRYSLFELSKMPPLQEIEVSLMDGRITFLTASRVLRWLNQLVELADWQQSLHWQIPPQQLVRIAQLQASQADDAQFIWEDRDQLLVAAEKLTAEPPRLPTVPDSFRATLRDYQAKGVAWLQHLSQTGQNGILADDMGLGKTVQTLAHIVLEQAAGRLTAPVLVVVPTSLLANWAAETRRWAPSLSFAVLHGNGRQTLFSQLNQFQLLFTTYSLLVKDAENWQQQPLSLLILDEAQAIKNSRTQAAIALKKMSARQRLCLSGTPLENHLGELWSLFDFLAPGFLFSEKKFQRYFRLPIEKYQDEARAKLLMSWVGPFMLRRKKNEVEKELPAKTEIIVSIPLLEAQRDLYETTRHAAIGNLQRMLPTQSAGEGHLMMLNALLRLRQLCCDPRLVDAEEHRLVPSAKRLRCLEMVQEMVEEGRRILLFSQFSRMLDLLAADLQQAAIPYLLLTGKTTNRGELVEQFQQGKAAVFLISLKAGGTGLNLTAADVVIHFDPWWNGAAEQQATDRAYRIGQTKPIFVYKLITEESVEEKVHALQQDKQKLLDAVYVAAEETAQQWLPESELPSSSNLLALLEAE